MASLTTSYYSYFYTTLVASGFSILFHITGLYAIYLHKKKSNQNLIFSSISIFEIITSIYRIAYDLALNRNYHENFKDTLPQPAKYIFFSFYYLTGYAVLFTMYVLTLDRLLCALNPLKYKIQMTRNRTRTLLFLSCIFASSLGIGTGFTPSFSNRMKVSNVAFFFGSMYVIFVVVTYILIAYKLQSSKSRLKAQRGKISTTSRRKTLRGLNFRKEFCVPTILISTHLIFFVVPFFVLKFVQWEGIGEIERRSKNSGYHLCYLLLIVGCIADALSYIILVKHYRQNIIASCTLLQKRLCVRGKVEDP